MLSYDAAMIAARDISAALDNATDQIFNEQKSGITLFVLTPNDVQALEALNVVLARGNTLSSRIYREIYSIKQHCLATPVPTVKPTQHSLATIGQVAVRIPLDVGSTADSTISSWISTVSSLTQVQEKISPTSVLMSDDALARMIGSWTDAAHHGKVRSTVVVPSAYLAIDDYDDSSPLTTLLQRIDSAVETLRSDQEAAFSRPACKATTNNGKLIAAVVPRWLQAGAQFEAAFAPDGQSESNEFLSRVLYGNQIAKVAPNPDAYAIALVHTELSGGSDRVAQSTLTGSREYYSGGLVASYSLFSGDGSLICWGTALGYSGFIRGSDVSQALDEFDRAPPVGNASRTPAAVHKTTSTCVNPP